MLFNLLSWLDASPAHYWLVAWITFGFAVVLALMAVCFPRTQGWWQHPIIFSVAMLIVLLAFRWPLIFDNRQYPDPDESQFIAGALTDPPTVRWSNGRYWRPFFCAAHWILPARDSSRSSFFGSS